MRATGAITGTPTTAATSNLHDHQQPMVSARPGARAYAVTINAAITVNPATLPNGTVGIAYSQTVSATGGTGSYTFSVSAGSLPAGLSLNAATGAITGTPTTAATSNFTITATDGLGATGARAIASRLTQQSRLIRHLAEWHRRYRVLAECFCNGWRWLIHFQCVSGQLACRLVLKRGHRRHYRHADDCSDFQLHDHGDRWSWCYRRACLQRHDECGDHRQSGDVAERNGRCRLLADSQRNGWQRFVHV